LFTTSSRSIGYRLLDTFVDLLAVDGNDARGLDAKSYFVALDPDYRDGDIVVDDDRFVDATCQH
jgi:hypothetical protein